MQKNKNPISKFWPQIGVSCLVIILFISLLLVNADNDTLRKENRQLRDQLHLLTDFENPTATKSELLSVKIKQSRQMAPELVEAWARTFYKEISTLSAVSCTSPCYIDLTMGGLLHDVGHYKAKFVTALTHENGEVILVGRTKDFMFSNSSQATEAEMYWVFSYSPGEQKFVQSELMIKAI